MILNNISALLLRITRRTDLVLAVLMFAIVFMMILPLPTTLIDGLIAFNMGVAVTLLMVAIYLQTPLDFAAFPSVLLISTLFRLALSISTTRLILLQADAGEVIQTFGNFVVGGNLVVGLVVFLIITVVQFIVITKGAERVAEVSARFSLDAMPGKQMSIDGDMRAGLIDMEEARRRREIVQKESQLFGSMDGAMKFVKGDAIAGIIIVVVNIIGGITVGMLQRGLSIGEAMHTYSILTIGDGLVSQIPGLFIAITAGIVVTRVTSEEEKDLSSSIILQITRQPRAILVASVLLVAFGLVPGFPKPVFLGLALMLGLPTLISMRAKERAETDKFKGDSAIAVEDKTRSRMEPDDGISLTTPLMIDVDGTLQNHIDPNLLNDKLIEARRALYMELGVPFPGIKLRFTSSRKDGSYVILLEEVPGAEGELRPEYYFVRESEENLNMFSIPFEKGKDFLPGLKTVWVRKENREGLQKSGIAYMEEAEILVYHLSFLLKRNADSFIGIQETFSLMKEMEASFPELVKESQRVMPLQRVTDILKRLVSEEISIRDMRTILEALIEWGQVEKDPVMLAEYVRSALSRQISYKFSGGQNILPSYLFSSDLEETIRSAIRQTSSGSYLALDPEVSQNIVAQIKSTVGDITPQAQTPVLVTATDIRRYVRKLIETEIYELPVLSYQELNKNISIQPIKQITMPGGRLEAA